MGKPRTTKQHLIDKLIMGKLPLHKRHRKMSQYGGNGKRDQELENVMNSIVLDSTNTSIEEKRQLRASQFLLMVEIYISQLDDEVQRTVAEILFKKLVSEDKQFFDMSYLPQRLSQDLKKQYGTLENYTSVLTENFKQVAFENRISKMFSSIVDAVPKGLKEPLSKSELSVYCFTVDASIYNWLSFQNQKKDENKVDLFFVSGIGVMPEEYSEVLSIVNGKNSKHLNRNEVEIESQCWIDEIQAKYDDPYQIFYNGFFRKKVSQRLNDVFAMKYKDNIDDIIENNNEGKIKKQYRFDSSSEHWKAIMEDQFGSIYKEWKERLTPDQQRLVSLANSDFSNEQKAEIMNTEFPKNSATGNVKLYNKDNLRYPLEKLEDSLEMLLRSKGVLSSGEKMDWLKRNKKSKH